MATNSNVTEMLEQDGAQISNNGVDHNKNRRRPRVLLGITGSVAAIKGPELAVRLAQELNVDVRILLTRGGYNFWTKAEAYNSTYWNKLQKCLEKPNNGEKMDMKEQENYDILTPSKEREGTICIHYAEDEWKEWKILGDPVLHIDLRDWADIVLIAPLSAHTLAKLANGLCDDTLSCVIRAWKFGHYYSSSMPPPPPPPPTTTTTTTTDCSTTNKTTIISSQNNKALVPSKPFLVAPAMNTAMWYHPITQQQLKTIQNFFGTSNSNFFHIIPPQVKTLACGEIGDGALASVETILVAVQTSLLQL